jgi:hypothetical protein
MANVRCNFRSPRCDGHSGRSTQSWRKRKFETVAAEPQWGKIRGMDVERSSRTPTALRQTFTALFATTFILSLIVSIAAPEARLFSACLLAAYLVKTVIRVVNSGNRRDEGWQIAREIGLAARVLAGLIVTLAVLFAVVWFASRP